MRLGRTNARHRLVCVGVLVGIYAKLGKSPSTALRLFLDQSKLTLC